MFRRVNQGFTLIEVMIAVAIIGILTAIAIPSYSAYIRKARMQEAFTNLSDLRVKLEQRYQDFRSYGTTNTTCPAQVVLPTGDAALYFTFSCKQRTDGANANTDQSFIVTATGKDSMSGYDYSLNELNEQKTTKYKSTNVSKACWLISGSEC